jgi:uncharacterized delta-60 repeat protein
VRPDGRIVVVGSSLDQPLVQVEIPATQMAIAQLTPDGKLDRTFNTDGLQLVSFNLVGRTDRADAAALQGDGRLVVAGRAAYTAPFAGIAPLSDMAAIRLNPDGSLDTTFDLDGRVTIPFDIAVSNRDSQATGVAVQPSGRITLSGTALTQLGGYDFAAAQLQATGAIDRSFGTTGRVTVNLAQDANGPTRDTAYAAAVQAPGRLVVAGSAAFLPPPAGGGVTNIDAALVRLVIDPVTPGTVLVGGPANGATVALVPTSGTLAVGPGDTFAPGFTSGVRTASADVTGDGIPDLIGAAGPGGPPTVVIHDGQTGLEITRFNAFESSFTGGTFVSAADLTGDGKAELVVSPDRGGGPIVAVFTAAGQQITRFFGIDDPAFRGGARTALGDLTGDGTPDLIVAAGFGGGPRIALFNGADVAAGSPAPARLVGDFFAFENTLRNGVFVAAGDADGDGRSDLAFGAGPGGAPRVRILGGSQLLAAGPFNSLDEIAPTAGLADFFAGDPSLRGGVRPAFRNLNGNPTADLVAGSGENEPSRVRVFLDPIAITSATPTPTTELDPFGAVLPLGVFVG